MPARKSPAFFEEFSKSHYFVTSPVMCIKRIGDQFTEVFFVNTCRKRIGKAMNSYIKKEYILSPDPYDLNTVCR